MLWQRSGVAMWNLQIHNQTFQKKKTRSAASRAVTCLATLNSHHQSPVLQSEVPQVDCNTMQKDKMVLIDLLLKEKMCESSLVRPFVVQMNPLYKANLMTIQTISFSACFSQVAQKYSIASSIFVLVWSVRSDPSSCPSLERQWLLPFNCASLNPVAKQKHAIQLPSSRWNLVIDDQYIRNVKVYCIICYIYDIW